MPTQPVDACPKSARTGLIGAAKKSLFDHVISKHKGGHWDGDAFLRLPVCNYHNCADDIEADTERVCMAIPTSMDKAMPNTEANIDVIPLALQKNGRSSE